MFIVRHVSGHGEQTQANKAIQNYVGARTRHCARRLRKRMGIPQQQLCAYKYPWAKPGQPLLYVIRHPFT